MSERKQATAEELIAYIAMREAELRKNHEELAKARAAIDQLHINYSKIRNDINDAQQGLAGVRSRERAKEKIPNLLREMERFLPVLERLESQPDLWIRATEGIGISTLNGYRAAISKAKGNQ